MTPLSARGTPAGGSAGADGWVEEERSSVSTGSGAVAMVQDAKVVRRLSPLAGGPELPRPTGRGPNRALGDKPAAGRAAEKGDRATKARAADFDALAARVQACRRCPGMQGRRRVFGRLNGDPAALWLVVAEAPGRLGAERSGIPLVSDQSGRTFRRLCTESGVALGRAFLSNAVLCNPQDAGGNNRRPSRDELANCRGHLAASIAVIRPRLVVSLGRVALEALRAVCPHDLELRRDVGRAVPWHGRLLLPLYHPGPQALLHRGYAAQLADYRRLALLRNELERAVDAPSPA